MAKLAPSRSLERVEVQVINEIGIISHLAQTRLERGLPAGMTQPQFGVLNHFARRGGEETPAQLASAFQVTKGAMTNTLQRLEAQGYVSIRPDPNDGRRKFVAITELGLAAHEQALTAQAPRLTELLRTIPEAEFAAALPFLSKFRAWLDEHR